MNHPILLMPPVVRMKDDIKICVRSARIRRWHAVPEIPRPDYFSSLMPSGIGEIPNAGFVRAQRRARDLNRYSILEAAQPDADCKASLQIPVINDLISLILEVNIC